MSDALIREAELNHQLALDQPGRRFEPVAGSRSRHDGESAERHFGDGINFCPQDRLLSRNLQGVVTPSAGSAKSAVRTHSYVIELRKEAADCADVTVKTCGSSD